MLTQLSLTVGASDDNYESDDSGTQCDCDACQEPIILVTLEPHLLYKQLEAQIQEWVIETELRQLESLLDTDNVDNIPHLFISGLLESYKNLMAGAELAFPILEELQATHLSKFKMTWQLLNEHIYQSCVYADPLVQNNVPVFIGKLSSTSESMESNKDLVKEFLYLDDNINSVSELWSECKRGLEAYAEEQALIQGRRALLEMEWKCFKAEGGGSGGGKTSLINKTLKKIVTSEKQCIHSKNGSCKRSKFVVDTSKPDTNKCSTLTCDCMKFSHDANSNSSHSHQGGDKSHSPGNNKSLSNGKLASITASDHKLCADSSCGANSVANSLTYDDIDERPSSSTQPRTPSRVTSSSSSSSASASHAHSHMHTHSHPHPSTGVKATNTSSHKQSKY
ncbi:protein FAM193A-like [Diaphorina citri]|uniref:Protein FAM193A-like n=1 Tax=Diaphorina citri TaxID=121845 RepID=A0A3Q0IVX8_DIACI|nr:protein FAM193A-like [Diaphorina citri]